MEAIPLGTTVERGTVRIHRFSDQFVITDIENAGKRGKVCAELSVAANGRMGDIGGLLADLGERLAACSTFAEADRAVLDHLRTPTPGALGSFQTVRDPKITLSLYRSAHKGVHVQKDIVTLTVRTDAWVLDAEPTSFRLRDLTDPNESTLIPRDRKVSSVKALRDWVRSDAAAIAALPTFSKVWDAMQARGIDAHYFCAMD